MDAGIWTADVRLGTLMDAGIRTADVRLGTLMGESFGFGFAFWGFF
jgi:hypothetical protein